MTPEELRAWRTDRKMSRATLADWLEIAPATLRNYEQGVRIAPPFTWRALRDIEAAMERGELPKPRSPRPQKRRASTNSRGAGDGRA